MKKLIELHLANHEKVSDKWSLYFDIYDDVFSRNINDNVSILEVGIQNGGSLEVISNYFKNAVNIIGCDINSKCSDLQYKNKNIKVVIGDASTVDIKNKIQEICNSFDYIIDDGSHNSRDIIQVFCHYFPLLKDGGVFVIEDLHCSYWKEFEGGLFDPYSSISFFKLLIDNMNKEHWGISLSTRQFFDRFILKYKLDIDEEIFKEIAEIRFFNSICTITRRKGFSGIGNRVVNLK